MNDQKVTHTPGPWDVSRDATPDYHYQATVHDENGDRVATAFVSEANARLIAAAPDLLAALRAMVEEFGDYDHMEASEFIKDLMDQVHDAIAKATGEQS